MIDGTYEWSMHPLTFDNGRLLGRLLFLWQWLELPQLLQEFVEGEHLAPPAFGQSSKVGRLLLSFL